MSLGWGLVGLGRIAATAIAPGIAGLEGSDLVAVAGRDAGRTAEFAGEFGVPSAYTSVDELLADEAVDVVYIATPNALHAEQVIAAAAAGKQVLCDKPLALGAADAERARVACEAAGVALGVMFQTRFHVGFGEVAELVREGAIGDVVVAEVQIGSGFPPPSGWKADPARAGLGTLNNQGIHGIDVLRFLLGDEVEEAFALAVGETVDTTATVLLRFTGGTIAYLHSSHVLPDPRNDIVLRGESGSVVAVGLSRSGQRGTIAISRGEQRTELAADSVGVHARALAAFAEAVRGGRPPSPSGFDGLRCAEVMDAIAASLRSGRSERVASAAGSSPTAPRSA
ncbi:MAG TPA: Gfo/Idh/MocA family oxidoreductase [Solirubrobacterales bacterium]